MEIVQLDKDSLKKYMKEFADLYTLCFNVPMNEEEVKWRYINNPHNEVLAYVALDNKKLVANYSASPVTLTVCGEDVKAALSLNTMTHPDYIGQGLFVKLASLVYEYMYNQGYQMILGFPNNISNRTFIEKLGWKDISIIPTLEVRLDRVKLFTTGFTDEVIEDNSFSLNYDRCLLNENEIGIKKSNEYLKWRYYQNPAQKYYTFVIKNNSFVSSRVIVKEYKDRLNIVDSYFNNKNEFIALINHCIKTGWKLEKRLLTLWLDMGSWEHLLLEKYGCVLAEPITYFGANIFGDNINKELCYNAGKWKLHLSDDNVY